MQTVICEEPYNVAIKNVPDAKIEQPTDVLVKITTTNICGSDLHMYEGRTAFEQGRIFGHENLGDVIEVGSAVDRMKVGDMVCVLFNVSCGRSRNCEAGLTAFCLTTNPDPKMAGEAIGGADMGRIPAGRPSICACPMPISITCGCTRSSTLIAHFVGQPRPVPWLTAS